MKKLPIFLALDVDTKSRALALAEKTHEYVLGYKIGPRLLFSSLLSSSGYSGAPEADRSTDSLEHERQLERQNPKNIQAPNLIAELKKYGSPKIFLDFKFYDIPSSTLGAVKAAYRIGADFATVHAAAGEETLKALRQWQKHEESLPSWRPFKILFVTVLSSAPASEQNQKTVHDLADSVIRQGFDGLVCSPWELGSLRKKYPHAFLTAPGIRLEGESFDDQKRVMTPLQALREGGSALVMGRSLSQAKDPVEILKKISQTLLPA